MWEITPYRSVGPIRFGMSEEELVGAVGPPESVETNHLGEPDHQYPGFAVRFSVPEDVVAEVGIFPEFSHAVVLRGLDIFGSPTAFDDLVSIDGSAFDCLGFIVMFKLGVALTGFHDNDQSQRALTVFTSGRFDRFRSHCVPYGRAAQR